MAGLEKWAVLRDQLPVSFQSEPKGQIVVTPHNWGLLRPLSVDNTPGGRPPAQTQQPQPW